MVTYFKTSILCSVELGASKNKIYLLDMYVQHRNEKFQVTKASCFLGEKKKIFIE